MANRKNVKFSNSLEGGSSIQHQPLSIDESSHSRNLFIQETNELHDPSGKNRERIEPLVRDQG